MIYSIKKVGIKMGLFKKKDKDKRINKNESDFLDELDVTGFDESKSGITTEPMETDTLENKKQAVENCCDRIASANSRIVELKIEYQTVNSYLNDIQKIENLPKPQLDDIVEYAKRVVVLDKDRKDFGKSMSKLSDKQFRYMRDNEEEIPEIIKTMAEDEKYCESVKTDMKYLEGEKTGLQIEIREQKRIINSLTGISKFAIGSFIILMSILLVMGYGYEKNVTGAIYIVIAAAVIFTAVIFVIRNKADYEMKLAKIRMNRAIGLLNKIKIKYVNIAGKLSYTYEKYGVKSAYQLSKVWSSYLTLKKEREVYNKASARLIEAEDTLVDLLKKANVKDTGIWISQAYALFSKSDMDEIKDHLNKRRMKLKKSLDYNDKIMEDSKNEIKLIVLSNSEYADELMKILEVLG